MHDITLLPEHCRPPQDSPSSEAAAANPICAPQEDQGWRPPPYRQPRHPRETFHHRREVVRGSRHSIPNRRTAENYRNKPEPEATRPDESSALDLLYEF